MHMDSVHKADEDAFGDGLPGVVHAAGAGRLGAPKPRFMQHAALALPLCMLQRSTAAAAAASGAYEGLEEAARAMSQVRISKGRLEVMGGLVLKTALGSKAAGDAAARNMLVMQGCEGASCVPPAQ